MPNWPFFCPYMNMFDDEDEFEDDEDFRSPDGMPPHGPGQGPQHGPMHGPGPGGPGMPPPPFIPGGPGHGGPGGPPPFEPGPGGFHGGPQGGYPPGPPPAMTPHFAPAYGISPKAVDPGAIRRCLYRYVFIRLDNGRQFWAWLTFVGRNSVAGYRWNGRRWVYFGIDLRRIDNFTCF